MFESMVAESARLLRPWGSFRMRPTANMKGDIAKQNYLRSAWEPLEAYTHTCFKLGKHRNGRNYRTGHFPLVRLFSFANSALQGLNLGILLYKPWKEA
jgi:hypothetical protein